jgi:tetratricopeptide (TPR) repeat protein
LGLLEYNNADYGAAASALEKAIAVQPDYSNARYFLGLSYARLGRTKDALTQFSRLSADNPDNQSVVSVITTLQSGKSLFTPASAPAAAAAKAPKLPLKQKGQ